jgi:hypothetical protein
MEGKMSGKGYKIAANFLTDRIRNTLKVRKGSGTKMKVFFFNCLKVHKNENFFGFDFEICTFS